MEYLASILPNYAYFVVYALGVFVGLVPKWIKDLESPKGRFTEKKTALGPSWEQCFLWPEYIGLFVAHASLIPIYLLVNPFAALGLILAYSFLYVFGGLLILAIWPLRFD